MRTWTARAFLAVAALALAGCARLVPLRDASGQTVGVSRTIAASLELVAAGDPAYSAADPDGGTGEPGAGKVTRPYVVRLTRDLAVYRLWAGPAVRDAEGRTSRIGQWWTFDRPAGTLAAFRRRYEVCEKWDTLRWVAQCTLRRGSVVVIGPGQSVSAQTCGDPSGRESYPANDRDLQLYIHEAWTRTGQPDAELSCPDESRDYENDPRNIAKPLEPRTKR
jgi:hypothetical protein